MKKIEETATAELVPIDAVTSDGRETETALETTPLVMSSERLLSIEQQLARLHEMNIGISLNARYREFSTVGEAVRGIYLGTKTIWKRQNGEKIEIPAVQWIDESKNLWINAGTILVNQLKGVPVGTAIEIMYTEKLKMEVGIAKNYDVRALYDTNDDATDE